MSDARDTTDRHDDFDWLDRALQVANEDVMPSPELVDRIMPRRMPVTVAGAGAWKRQLALAASIALMVGAALYFTGRRPAPVIEEAGAEPDSAIPATAYISFKPESDLFSRSVPTESPNVSVIFVYRDAARPVPEDPDDSGPTSSTSSPPQGNQT